MRVFKSITKRAYSPSGSLYVTELEYEMGANGEVIPCDLPPVVDATKGAPTSKKKLYGLEAYL